MEFIPTDMAKLNTDKSATNKDMVALYDQWNDYDKHVGNGPDGRKPDAILVAQVASSLLGDKQQSRILDVAAGTGFLATELNKLGFKNVDALDGSQSMLDRGQQKGVYLNTYCRLFSADPTPGLDEGSYDALVCTGGFGWKHLPAASITEFLRLTKKGGFVIIGVSQELLETDQDTATLEPRLKKLCDDGQCRLVERKYCPRFNFANKPGIIFVVHVL